MTQLQSLAEGIYCLDSGYIQPEHTAIYLLCSGDEVAIIETGTFVSITPVLRALSTLGIQHQQVKYIIPTHIHLDHAGGASGMMAEFTQARLIIHPRGARHMIDPSRLIAGSIAVYGEARFRQLYGNITPIDARRVDIARDLERYWLGNRVLVFLDTPGHARHHFCIYDAVSRGIFSGDSFGLSYPCLKDLPHGLIPSSSPVDFDPQALLKSVDRLLSYQPERIYLTHYGEIDRPTEKVHDFKRWVSDSLALCADINPLDASGTQALEDALRQMTLDKLAAQVNCDQKALLRLLAADLKLNAQGLAIWWQNRENIKQSA